MTPDSRSVLTRPAPPPDFTLRYGDHPDHVVDVWHGGGPLVIFLHGGFWRHEYDRTHTRPLAAALAANGLTVATPEYRRTGAPGGGWPGTFDDVAAAVSATPRLIADRVGATGPVVPGAVVPRAVVPGAVVPGAVASEPVAPGPVVLAGHSAGGHLALWAAAHAPTVDAVLALAPVAELYRADELDLDGGAVRALLGGGPTEVPERYTAAQPRVPMGAAGPAVRLLHGDADRHVPIELSRTFVARATAAGSQVTLTELRDTDHFALIDPESSAWPVVVATLRALVEPDGGVLGFDGGRDSG